MRRVFACLVLVLLVVSARAADPWSPSSSYDPAVPTPESVLGYKVGEQFTHDYRMWEYMERLAAASGRLRIEPYGSTVQGRPLKLVIVSAPENLARLEAIRDAMAQLSDPRQTQPAEARRLADSNPVVVFLSYNVHGNESVSMEAAMQVAFELAASQDPQVLDWLKNAVIILDPLVNPDGRERYVHFYRSTAGTPPRGDRFAAEHREPWPGGRFNHYLFDLNRDWAWQTQPESVARVRAYRQWNPQVHVDFHEMGAASSYYFAPPAQPIHKHLTPILDKWFKIYGRGNAAYFDRYNFRYFTGEAYDLYYPAFGDSWPSLNGAIGMTYEQAGGGVAGLKLDLADDQHTVTLRDRAARHFIASLATIHTSVENRAARLYDFYEFRRAAIRNGAEGPVRQYLLLPGRDPQRLPHLVEMLLRQGIEVQRADAEFDAEGLSAFWGQEAARKRLPAGTYVVDLAQPAGFLASAILEKDPVIEHLFFYDVTAWSLPYAMGVEAYASPRPLRATLTPVRERAAASAGVTGGSAGNAFVFSWEQSAAMGLLAALLEEDVKTYVGIRPFTVAGQEFAAGSVIVPAETNAADLGPRMRELATRHGVNVLAVPSHMVDQGIDLGSNRARFLRKPRVAVLMGPPVSPTDYGAIWHYLERRVEMPFTPLRAENLGAVDLNQYNVLILPPADDQGRAYSRYLNKEAITRIDAWVRGGGILIGLGGGAVFATKPHAGWASMGHRFVRDDQERARLEREKEEEKPGAKADKPEGKPENDAELQRKLMTWRDREDHHMRQQVPGAILRAVLDPSHPLGFGMSPQLAVLNRNSAILELTADGENPAYFDNGSLRLSGFSTDETLKRLHHTAYMVRERKGRGAVVLFADTPVFRGFWENSSRLLLNAIFFGNITDPYLER